DGRRVELNEMTSPQFLEWLEGKLRLHLPDRLIPADEVLAEAYRRALVVARMNKAIEDVRDEAEETAKATAIPKAMRKQLKKAMEDSTQAWDGALYEMAVREVESLLSEEDDD